MNLSLQRRKASKIETPSSLAEGVLRQPKCNKCHKILPHHSLLRKNETEAKVDKGAKYSIQAGHGVFKKHLGHDFGSLQVIDKGLRSIQPKLTISTPGDAGEKEADKVAEEVMNMPDALLETLSQDMSQSRRPAISISNAAKSTLARMKRPEDAYDSAADEESADEFEAEDGAPDQSKMIERAAANTRGARPDAPPCLARSIDDSCRGGGQTLPRQTRQFMESRFGYDFGAVRIHADGTAGDLAHQVRARAFTTNTHIFFARNEYQPEQMSGKKLLAHELAHVVQQNKGNSMNRLVQRSGNGSLNCPIYAGYDTSKALDKYNCAGLAHRTYDRKDHSSTRAALAKGSMVDCGKPCDHVGVVKHWLWEYDVHTEFSDGRVRTPPDSDFHTVGGPTDGDPAPMDSDEYYSKNGKRKVYGPGTAPSFRPPAREQSTKNDPNEEPVFDHGKPVYKVRSNFAESCYCLQCPNA
ncbi:Uncharacterised protein [uncultured archaeon]|nr:Uncharacterised protein [uncultured archaeon]